MFCGEFVFKNQINIFIPKVSTTQEDKGLTPVGQMKPSHWRRDSHVITYHYLIGQSGVWIADFDQAVIVDFSDK